MGDREIKILCYADDAILMAGSEEDLQILQQQFNRIAKKIKMIISATKCMITSRTPLRFKLGIDNEIGQEEMKFKYHSIEMKAKQSCKNSPMSQYYHMEQHTYRN